jgi:hypothetical protein
MLPVVNIPAVRFENVPSIVRRIFAKNDVDVAFVEKRLEAKKFVDVALVVVALSAISVVEAKSPFAKKIGVVVEFTFCPKFVAGVHANVPPPPPVASVPQMRLPSASVSIASVQFSTV